MVYTTKPSVLISVFTGIFRAHAVSPLYKFSDSSLLYVFKFVLAVQQLSACIQQQQKARLTA